MLPLAMTLRNFLGLAALMICSASTQLLALLILPSSSWNLAGLMSKKACAVTLPDSAKRSAALLAWESLHGLQLYALSLTNPNP